MSLTEEHCTTCGKGDHLLSDLSSDDSEDIEETIEFEWVQCSACRAYHNSCLHSAIGEDGRCIYCDFD